MSKFIYKMQNLLEIKKKMETQAKMNYAAMRIRLTQEEEKLNSLHTRKKNYETEGRNLRLDQLKIQDIIDNKQAILKMDEYIKNQVIQVHVAQKNLEAARLRLEEAMKERKIHEKLRENAFEEFLTEEKRSEGKEVDELTSYVYSQRIEEDR